MNMMKKVTTLCAAGFMSVFLCVPSAYAEVMSQRNIDVQELKSLLDNALYNEAEIERLRNEVAAFQQEKIALSNDIEKIHKTSAITMALAGIPNYVSDDKIVSVGFAGGYNDGVHGFAGAIDTRAYDFRFRVGFGTDKDFDVQAYTLGMSKSF